MPPHDGERWLRFIDVDIRPLVAALNRLPFVACTVFSCAGCGIAGEFERCPADHPEDSPLGHFPGATGYVWVAYRPDAEWLRFHAALTEVFDRAHVTDVIGGRSEISYYLDNPGHDDQMRARWSRIADLVAGWT